ncbi:DAK2 domain-containing protein [Bacillaceae bacterium SIJ1]|nr:DAK2 domain-containing protein [Litoribacterium kuwaitense]NGP44162.1 DAK2 domain-containing protein [Litoribacterium kuwaitense]
MLMHGGSHLTTHAEMIDALNVFPVPDGDTGTNMNLTMTSGVNEARRLEAEHAGKVASSFARGLLMGARGNSGVILSQLFRGFAKHVEQMESLSAKALAEALQAGVNTAYKAVMKPVEGTILTVAKDAAQRAVEYSEETDDAIALFENVLIEAKASLDRTPTLLPVLKEVGVVDSGGQGLVTIYEGFLAALKGEELPDGALSKLTMNELVKAEHHRSHQGFMRTEDIEYGYCTEFMVKLEEKKQAVADFDEEAYRDALSEHGDSLLVVADDELVKVHIHTEFPGDVMTYSQKFGSLINMKIENMREQHAHATAQDAEGSGDVVPSEQEEEKPFGFVTVAMGTGVSELFTSLGADVVIEGGQTMNPSTEKLVEAIKKVPASCVFVVPNNSNIVMTAKQAAELADKHVIVVPTKTIPQGLSAFLAFDPALESEANLEQMEQAMKHVKSGQLTYAVRDTSIEGKQINKDDYMGILEGDIVIVDSYMMSAVQALIKQMVDADDELLTLLLGEDVTEEEEEELTSYIATTFAHLELEVHRGDQPLYPFIISVE